MTAFIASLNPIVLRTSSVMSTGELAAWAQLGKNSIPRLIEGFGIRELSGSAKNHRYSVHDVMRQILGVTVRHAEDLEPLLYPLQKSTWVAAYTGLSVSAINAAICEKRLTLPAPIELTHTDHRQAAARGRRWVPAQIDAYLRNEPIPFIPTITTGPAPKTASQPISRNVFAAICSDNAKVSRQCHL
ncbi:hypothetical protein [Celeribacter sp.]|uniref:hypothetical protein n=1 Tax=Celeribacter sp. TaxID=1890673 RepID=UPI003A94AA70